MLRVRGRNLTESEWVKLGAYHSLELEQQRAFTVHKAAWDALDVERIKTATDPKLSADLAAVLIVVGGRRRLAAEAGKVAGTGWGGGAAAACMG
jgi:protein pelota